MKKRTWTRRRGLEGPLPLNTRVIARIVGHEELGWVRARAFDGPCLYDLQLDSGYQVLGVPATSVAEEEKLGQNEPDQ
jgi:hypothetical protein